MASIASSLRLRSSVGGLAPQRRRAAPLQRAVAIRAAQDGADAHPDHHFTADTIAWNAQHLSTLRRRISQVRAAEVVAESTSSRPERPADGIHDEEWAAVMNAWHEQQWNKLRASQHSWGDDELGHFGGA